MAMQDKQAFRIEICTVITIAGTRSGRNTRGERCKICTVYVIRMFADMCGKSNVQYCD